MLCMRSVIAAAVLVSLGGCVVLETHGDRTIPEQQRAIVEGYWHYRFLYDEELHIVSVDGQREAGRTGWPYAYSVSLPAGRHWLRFVILRNGGAIAGCAFEWTFQAGRHYKLQRLHHDQFLLAHPAAERFKGALDVLVSAPDETALDLSVPVECGRRLMCREDVDCPSQQFCREDAGFDFGVCVPLGF